MMKQKYLLLLCLVLFINSAFESFAQVYARNGMVSSSSMIASQAGCNILRNGGNAIDAAVATAFVLAVTHPEAGNIGGGGFLVYMTEAGEATTIDFREKAPLAASRNMFLDERGQIFQNSNHYGIKSVGIPGTVAGLYYAHQKYGNLPWAELVQPAIDLAKKGFVFTWELYHNAEKFYTQKKDRYPDMVRYFSKSNGELYQPGEIWQQKELAACLKRIREKGKDGFYKGKTAELLTKFMKEQGGLITLEDLEKYRAIERKPVKGTYRAYDVYSMGPPSSGGVTLLEMLNMLEGYDLKSIGYGSAQYFHILAEVMRRAYADRAENLGDPDFNLDMPLDKLLSKEYAAKLRTSINLERASFSDSAKFGQVYEGDHTTHFSVCDAQGNAVSLTYTIESSYGSGIVPEGLGFILNNEMGDFNPVPGITNTKGQIGTAPNLVAPEKRMLSSMTPTIIAKEGKPVLIIGSPGGRTIINSVLQVILNVLDHGMNIKQAIEAGKIHHSWLPDIIKFEAWGLSPDTRSMLKDMGHNLQEVTNIGRLMGIYIDYKESLLTGAADSASPDGGVAGY